MDQTQTLKQAHKPSAIMFKTQSIKLADSETLARRLGDDVIALLQQAIEQRGQALLVVSGGSTPKPFFNYLATQDIDWSRVTVTLADERCVDPNDPASNAGLVRRELLIDKAASARLVLLYDGGQPTVDDQINAGLRLLSLPKYDAVILGMGGDGHTASIFPQATNRAQALNMRSSHLALLTDPVTVGPLRITQTAARLLNTRFLALHATGAEKGELVDRILAAPNPARWPIAHFLTQNQIDTHIYATTAASSQAVA